MKKRFTCLFAAMIAASSFAQTWTSYTTESTSTTLPSDLTNSIDVDTATMSKWIATSNGLAEFDGWQWKRYYPIINYINDGRTSKNDLSVVMVDSKGNKWCSSRGYGIYKYDGKDWTIYDNNNRSGVGVPGNAASSIKQDLQGRMWFAGHYSVVMFDGIKWTEFKTGPIYNISDIEIDSKGDIWFSGTGGLCKFDKSFTVYNLGSNHYFNSLAIDKEGNKWLTALNSSAVTKFDGASWAMYPSTIDNARNFNNITIDSAGKKWLTGHIGSAGREDVSLIQIDGTSWKSYTPAQGLLSFSNAFTSITPDENGHLWLTTAGRGVLKFDGTTWTNYRRNGLSSNFITAIAIDQLGNKWFGTNAGVSVFDNLGWNSYTTSDGLVSNDIRHIAIDLEGTKWFATNAGVSKFDGKTWTNYTTKNGLVNNDVRDVLIDNIENKWFATYAGLTRFDGKTWKTYTTKDGLLANNITDIAIDKKGNIWVGSYLGASMFDGISWTNFTQKDGLIATSATKIAVDNNDNKWISSYTSNINQWYDGHSVTGGLSRYDNKEFSNFPYAPGIYLPEMYPYQMSYTNIYDIAADDKNNIWTATNRGVSRFNETDSTVFTVKDGLLSANVFQISIDNQGNKWFGTDRGISMLTEEDVITSAIENRNAELVSAFPNPFADQTTISLPQIGNYTITVSNVQGQTVSLNSLQNAQSMTLSFEGLPEGIYLYTAVDHKTDNRYQGKLMLKK